jgi:hypothetical protein
VRIGGLDRDDLAGAVDHGRLHAVAVAGIEPERRPAARGGGKQQRRWKEAVASLSRLCRQHGVELIAIGNGTASRETDRLATEILAANPDLKMAKVTVSEAGASVYSASAIATRELPDLDVSHRGAVPRPPLEASATASVR